MTDLCGWVLGLDTSTQISSVALARIDSGQIMQIHEGLAANDESHNEELLPLIDSLFKKAKLGVEQLSSIMVGAGPGSFTGLRIGFGAAKGLSFALKKPVVNGCSLTAMAWSGRREGECVFACSDARRSEYFCRGFLHSSENEWREILPAGILSADALKEVIRTNTGSGTGATKRVAVICGHPDRGDLEPYRCLEGKAIAQNLIEIALNQKASPTDYNVTQLSSIQPNYIRPVAAKTIRERLAERLNPQADQAG
ncbi:MAG: tRNA (adenosine(37)-N6)-threonylcarbamoyltransferase complex dimerization subunit type 1 TsaB [Proteobacteria bacterium]|nr:MAG: tRNA (adenosine(37)-N6)-threonylcarbamoyltransferase complex dimerization subunit type 1 TsaB [Pseudomonadota bacterium]